MFTVGTRELKDRLPHYLRLVRQGMTLIVTDRGKPVAVVKPAQGDEAGDLTGQLAHLATEGEITLPRGQGFLAKPPSIKGSGKPLSELVREGRR